MRRADIEAKLVELRKAAAIEPVHSEKFLKAYWRIKAVAFYLSPDQIEEVNRLWAGHWERRQPGEYVIEALRPDPEMTDEYLID
jgi:hypothetical protein